MSTNVEIEFKSALSQDDYNKLINKYQKEKIYPQNNFYFDTNELQIRERKAGLRVRELNGKFELTLKLSSSEGKIEINQQISNILFDNLINNYTFPEGEVRFNLVEVLNVDIPKIRYLGNLLTYRMDLNYKNALISIDKSLYNGIVDYEIEIEDESMEKAETHLKEFLKENEIEYKKSPGSKLKRFLESIN